MRKILSAKEIEAKQKRKTLLISIFMLSVLIVGTVGYGFLAGPGSSQQDDNSGEIQEGVVSNAGNHWATVFEGLPLYFTTSPEEAKNISINLSRNVDNYRNLPLYIDSENQAIISQIGSTLGKFTSHFQEACYGSCERDLPEKNCTENIIVWRDLPENKVYQKENCVFIEGDIRAVDAFLYTTFRL